MEILFEVSSGLVVVKTASDTVPCVFQQWIGRRSNQTVGVAVCQGVEHGVLRRAHCPSQGIRSWNGIRVRHARQQTTGCDEVPPLHHALASAWGCRHRL